MVLAAAMFALPTMSRAPAHADGGDHEGGGDHGSKNSGGGNSGNSGGGASGSGSGEAKSSPGDDRASGNSDQYLARDALLRGWIQPLDQVLQTAQKSAPGRVLDVSLEHTSGGAWTYNIVVLTQGGRYLRIYVDAARNRILQIK